LKNLFTLEKKPVKGFMLFEWAMLAYAIFTLLIMALTYTRLHNPMSMLWLRFQSIMMLVALWAVYRMLPCRLTMLFRVLGQLALLGTWYPETFEFNRVLPNLDHVFATWEQQLFGFQPALLFSQKISNPVFSELLTLGYVSYYPLMVVVSVYYFLYRYNQFLRSSFIILASFFLFYVIFIFLPVAGPQYYYLAAGLDNIANGVFPNIGNYFETHTEALPAPGFQDGPFYKLLVMAHNAGERPTAAFPSSHVGVTTVLLWLAWATGHRRFFWWLVPFGVLMFFATFYIQAHYAIDAIAGLFVGTIMYFLLRFAYGNSKC
jgi:membrane-associated phospholipid phosphatase